MTAIRLEVDVEIPDWDALDVWHLRQNLPIPTDRLAYLIDRSHVSRCEYEFVDTLTSPAAMPPAAAVSVSSRSVAAMHPRPGAGSDRSTSP